MFNNNIALPSKSITLMGFSNTFPVAVVVDFLDSIKGQKTSELPCSHILQNMNEILA